MEMSRIRIFILWLQWVVLGRKSVVLIDFDGMAYARLSRGYGPYRWAKRHGFGISNVRLCEDGTTQGVIYVRRWEPLFPRAAQS